MVSNIFRPMYFTLSFAHNNHCYHIIGTMIERVNNAFGFSKCNFGIRSGFKNKKPKFWYNSDNNVILFNETQSVK